MLSAPPSLDGDAGQSLDSAPPRRHYILPSRKGDSRLFDVIVIPMRSPYVHLGLAGNEEKPARDRPGVFFGIPSITRDLGAHRASRVGAVPGCVLPKCRDRINPLTP